MISEEIIGKLEQIERIANERGVTLETALQRTINLSVGDSIILEHGKINTVPKEIWEFLVELDAKCKEKGYRTSDVIYRASGDLWDNAGCHYPTTISEQSMKRLKNIRNGMIQRCTNENDAHYPTYGGRGVSVYYDWLHDAHSFINWAENNGYEDYLTLDRINPYGNYEPDNCRWATTYTQAHNKRETKKNKTIPFRFRGAMYSENVLARIEHLTYEKLKKNRKNSSTWSAVMASREPSFWDRSEFEIRKDQDEEKRIYNSMSDGQRYVYDSLVRSCVENDADIYEVLRSLIGDIDRSMVQVAENKVYEYYQVGQR